MGDTGEMVANGYALFVPHPPGYPLFTWLIHGFTHAFEVGTVFWRAAFLNQMFAIGSVMLCLYLLRQTPWLGMAAALLLATSRLFWKFAVLPDVFALHALFAAGILVLYFEESLQRYRPYAGGLFILALAHHHTIVFLAPVVAHAVYLDRRQRKTWVILGGASLVTAALYSSLMLFQPNHFWSWGKLDSFAQLWRHFLRADYGTFKLVSSQETGSYVMNLTRFLAETAKSFLPLCAAIAAVIIYGDRHSFRGKEALVMGVLALYIGIFFWMANIDLVGFRIETFDRFFIFPQVVACILIARLLSQTEVLRKGRRIVTAALLTGVIFNLVTYSAGNNFSKNTIIEDYALKLFRLAPENKPVTLWTTSDTRYNAVKYAQTVLGVRKDILAVHPTMLLFPWYAQKSMRGGLVVRHYPLTREHDIQADDFVTDNLERFAILATFTLENHRRYRVTYLPVGILLEKGWGVAFAPESATWNGFSDISLTSTPDSDYDVFREMWNEYGVYFFKKADVFFKKQDFGQAKAELLKGLDLVPWSLTIRANLCVLAEMNGENPVRCRYELFQAMGSKFRYY